MDFTNRTCGYQGTHESSPDYSSHLEDHPPHTEFNRMLRVSERILQIKLSPLNFNSVSSPSVQTINGR